MRLILDIDDKQAARLDALAALDTMHRADEYWKVNYGWTVRRNGFEFWVKRTKTGYSVKLLNQL